MSFDIEKIDFTKGEGLVPAIVQDAASDTVLMLGYMNADAVAKTQELGKVTFFSRSKNRLWTKGETSGNTLKLVAAHADCDNDSLLVLAIPNGPTCHRNTDSCYDGDRAVEPDLAFLASLERLVAQREIERPDGSYTTRLFESGIKRMAQKVGEEGLETALAATVGDREELVNEAADLLYHLLVLLRASKLTLADVTQILQNRHGG